MAKSSYLQLYLDTDYILPVAVGADGNLVKYQQDDRRLWLYFLKSGSNDSYGSGKAIKANFEANIQGSYGNFWEKLETGELVGAELFPYVELLEIGGHLDKLRTWCKAILSSPTPPVVLNFAATIGMKARKVFADYLTKKGFSIIGYSTEINELVAEKVVYDHHSTLTPAFGDQLLIVQSAGSKLLLSTLTWGGDAFMQGEKSTELEKQGEDFRRRELATMVIDKMEQSNGRLTTEAEREAEIAFQMQFADEWYKSRIDSNIRIRGFYYMRYPDDVQPSITVDANQLELRVEANSRTTTEAIQKYYKKNIVKSHLYTVFFGDVFCDGENGENPFRKRCVDVTDSLGKYAFFSDNALQEAMGRYYYSHGDLQESVEELESRYLKMEDERERIRKYVRNAETLGGLRDTIEDSSAEMRKAIDNVKSRTTRIEDSWTAYMQQSKFDAAEAILSEMSSDDALTMAKSHLYDSLVKIEASNSLLEDLKQLNEIHVKEIVEKIFLGYNQLQELQTEANDLEIRPKELKDRTQHYREAYGTYLEIKRRLDKEQSMGGKKRVLEELKDKDLTMEPLPEVNVKPVNAEFICSIESSGGGLFKKKKYSLNVTLQVKDGDVLPFPCVIMIANSNKVTLDRNDWCADVNAGESQWSNTISIDELPKGDKFVVHLFPDEKNSFKRTSLYCESKQVKIK